MTKKERRKVMSKMKPQSWYTYCQLEAIVDGEVVKGTKVQLAGLLDITVPTLNKYLEVWQEQGLVREMPGGFVVTQLDGELNPEVMLQDELPPRTYNAKKIIDYWCECYEQHYHEQYRVSNWTKALVQVKPILRYSDLEIEGAIETAINRYDELWTTSKFSRPTIGGLTSFIFEQSLSLNLDKQ